MANWCFNTVTFKAEADQIEKLRAFFLNMQAESILKEAGQLPGFIQSDAGHMFEIDFTGDTVNFVTKWIPNLEIMCQIANHFGAEFTYHYGESGNGIYGEATYEKGILRDIYLEITDFARYTYNEEKDVYLFEGNSYKDSNEILEILLERRKAN
jgi:hypothetical protein